MELAPHWLVSISRLRKCKLWPGSMEQQNFLHGGLTVKWIQGKIERLKACDDLTSNEREYMSALKDTLANWPN